MPSTSLSLKELIQKYESENAKLATLKAQSGVRGPEAEIHYQNTVNAFNKEILELSEQIGKPQEKK